MRVLAAESEEQIGSILETIDADAAESLTWVARSRFLGESDAEQALAEIEAWASLASYAVTQFYTAFEPPEGLPGGAKLNWSIKPAIFFGPGWDEKIVEKLRRFAKTLRPLLEKVCRALGAAQYSVAVGFPGGVSIGLSWTGAQIATGVREAGSIIR